MAVAMASFAILFILISPSVVRGRQVPESEKKIQSRLIISDLVQGAFCGEEGQNLFYGCECMIIKDVNILDTRKNV